MKLSRVQSQDIGGLVQPLTRQQKLVRELNRIPSEFKLTPIYRKHPYRPNYQDETLTRQQIGSKLVGGDRIQREDGSSYTVNPDGIAIQVSVGYVWVEIDGRAALHLKRRKQQGKQDPLTVSLTSGRPGRGGALYKLPESLSDRLANLKHRLGKVVLDEGIKHYREAIELHLSGQWFNSYYSAHPMTDGYRPIKMGGVELRFGNVEIAESPEWVNREIEQAIERREAIAAAPAARSNLDAIDGESLEVMVQQLLDAIDPDCHYDEWFRVLAAVKSAEGRLSDTYSLVLDWSARGSKFDAVKFDRTWDSIEVREGGCTLKTLFWLAGIPTPGTGFEFGSKSKKELRDKLIADRTSQFLKYWSEGELKKNVFMSKADLEYEGFCPWLDLTQSKTFLVQGGLGSGKTEAVVRAIAQAKDKIVVWLTGRNGLLKQTRERLAAAGIRIENLLHYQSDAWAIREQMAIDTKEGSHTGTTVYTLCVDSLKSYSTGAIDFSRCVAVIDEFSSVRKEIHQKRESFPEFERIMQGCDQLIVMDAFLSDADRGVIKRYRGRDRIVYRQKFKQSPVKIEWVETLTKSKSKKEEPYISFSHEGIYFSLLKRLIDSRKNGLIAVATDNKAHAKAAAMHLKQKGLKVLLCCYETIESNNAFLENPDKVLQDYDAVVYTPTAESGLDIQSNVDAGLFLYSGVVDPLSALQMMGRCRRCPIWAVSAPRYAIGGTPANLSGETAVKLGKHFSELFNELGFSTVAGAAAWQQWDESVRQISKSYGSEFLRTLLEHFFGTTETVFIEGRSASEWRDAVADVRNSEVRLTLRGNLAKGQALKEAQKAPSTDAEVWDLTLAVLHDKMPALTQWAIEALPKAEESGDDDAVDDILGLVRGLRSSRLEKLKLWRMAQDPQAADNLREWLQELLFIATNSRALKQYTRLRLYQSLKLERLARVAPEYDDRGNVKYLVKPNETGFSPESPIVVKLWQQFCRDVELRKLFPTATSIEVFWHLCCRCMAAMGFQSKGKAIRVKTQERHANGKGRSGETRYVNSKAVYFAAWLIQCCSGSKVFQKYFDKIMAGLDDWIARDEERRTDFKRRRSEREAIAA